MSVRASKYTDTSPASDGTDLRSSGDTIRPRKERSQHHHRCDRATCGARNPFVPPCAATSSLWPHLSAIEPDSDGSGPKSSSASSIVSSSSSSLASLAAPCCAPACAPSAAAAATPAPAAAVAPAAVAAAATAAAAGGTAGCAPLPVCSPSTLPAAGDGGTEAVTISTS